MQNMEMTNMNRINLRQYRPVSSLSFSGRSQGEAVRSALNLNKVDSNDEEVEIVIPADTTSFNPSFFLGLLYDSIAKLGIEKFKTKYRISIETTNPILKDALDKNLADAIRNAMNSLSNRSGLNIF